MFVWMACLNIFIAGTRRTWMNFSEIENREEEHLEKQKEMKKTRRRHTKNNLNDVMFFAWL